MKIMNATIYGFGKWVDYSIDFHTNGFTAIYGENESGKTTLHQFVLFMLFGLPPKQRNFYRPKTSGKMGGRLTVEDPDAGIFTIERLDEVNNGAAVCYTADGKEFDETWLNDKLKGLTKKTYQSIFSFSSVDLHLINHMKEDDLAEVLLGIGMTGSAAIYSVEKRLDQQMGELYKPRGAKPLINKQLTSLDHLHRQLQQTKDTEETYREWKENQNTLNRDILENQQRIEEKKRLLRTIEKQQQALPYFQQYIAAVKQLEAFPEVLHFPEQGITRLEKMKDKLLPLKSEQSILQNNQLKYEQKIKMLQQEVDGFPWNQVTKLLEMKEHWEQRNKDIMQYEDNLHKIEAQLENEINQLDVAIAPEELAELHLPFHIEREWHDIKDSKEQFELEKEKVDQEQEELHKQEQYVKQDKSRLEAQLLSDLQKNELKVKIKKFQEHALSIKWQEKTANQKPQLEKKKKHANGILTGSALAGLIIGGTGFFLELSMLYFFMIAIFLFGFFLWYSERKSIKEMAVLLQQDVRELQSEKITAEDKKEAEQLLSRNENRLLEWRALEDQAKNLNLQRLKWEEKRNFINEKYKRLQKQMDEQLDKYPLLTHLEVRYWPEMYHRLKHIMRLVRDKKDIQQKMEILKQKNTHFQEDVDTYFQQEQPLPLETALEMLEEKLERANNLQKQIAHYKDQRDENAYEQDTLKQNLQVYKNEMTVLFTSAEVETEDEFYQKAKQLEEQAGYEQEKIKAEEQLSRILSEADRETLPYDIPEESALIDKHQHTKRAVEKLETSLDQRRDEFAQVNAKLEQLEASESYSSLLHQMEMEKEELNRLAKKWAVLKTAKEMLLETKRNYRDMYLHKVMDKTTDYFAKLTEGSYTKVFAPDKDNSFYAVASDHTRYHVNELSRGTIDQLYVSLRLAISDILSKEYRIPFIMDDAFIHFDGLRTKRVMELIHDISGTQQVIVFTCKKEILNHAPASQTIQLEKSNVKGVV